MTDRASRDNALMVAEAVKALPAELDMIVLADKKPDAMIADRRAAGYDDNLGLKLISPSVVAAKSDAEAEAVAAGVGTSRRQRRHTAAQETR
jgi:hypothetical protein